MTEAGRSSWKQKVAAEAGGGNWRSKLAGEAGPNTRRNAVLRRLRRHAGNQRW